MARSMFLVSLFCLLQLSLAQNRNESIGKYIIINIIIIIINIFIIIITIIIITIIIIII
jgi:hypothetical protein